MRILITGSSGQIGTNLALHLIAQGHFVFGVDKRSNRWTDKIPTLIQDLGAPYTNFKGGIGFVEYPEALDVVVHLAAHAKVHELVEQPDRALANITMTYNVLEFCRQNHLPIIFSSSREVYGDIHRYITDETNADFAFTESPYSASKIAGEALIYSYAQCYDLPYIVFRFSNVYGRYDNDIERMERVIPLFIRKIKRGEPIIVYGEKKVLDFTYVDDCVAGVSKAVELMVAGKIKNETINLAYGQGNSLIAMATFIADALGKPTNMTVAPARVGEVTHYVANIDRARTLLGYEPQTPLQEGIRRAVAWSTRWWADHGMV
jgi:UDP-glucose 4-epimerase